MAAGSSAPELFTSIVATFFIVNEGGVGAIIGSAIFNILVIVGATCVFAGQVLIIWWYPVARDCSFYMLSIAELAYFIMDDETVQWWEALIMFGTYCVYCVYMKYNERVARLIKGGIQVDVEVDVKQSPRAVRTDGLSMTVVIPVDGARKDSVGTENSVSTVATETSLTGATHSAGGGDEGQTHKPGQWIDLRDEASPEQNEGSRKCVVDPVKLVWGKVMPSPKRYWSLFFMSILNIAICTYIMVDAVNRSGCNLNVSPLIMGLIFLAAGTSIPDALGSIAVAKQGEGDMAVANALGSNVFDILLGLGVPWLISAALGQEVTFKNASTDLLYWICVLVGVVVLFIAALIFNGWKLNKTVGVLLMTLYVIHVSIALIGTFNIPLPIV
jgi:K+-dependent Na+/Ca+ exchanger-like protein